MNEIKDKFNVNLKKLISAEKSVRVLVTVSGGIDSMVLADLFHQHKISFGIAHCNFQLRGTDSEKDEAFVASFAKKINVPLFCKRFNTAGYSKSKSLSIQMAARQLRYDWFAALCNEHHYDYIATAHHADDNTETMLLNFIRGKSITAIAGIPFQNNNIIRPLLTINKNEIRQYASENELMWREDQSNESVEYDRNFLRLQVLPLLQELNPSLTKSMLHVATLLKEAASFIDQEFFKWKSANVITADKKTDVLHLRELNNHLLKSNLLYQILVNYNFQPGVIRQISENLLAQPGSIFLSPTHQLIFDRDSFSIIKNVTTDQGDHYWINAADGRFMTGDTCFTFELMDVQPNIFQNLDPYIAFADAGALTYPLLLRHWQEGDVFCPLGMSQHKKVSDFFTDEKIPLTEKGKVWFLISNGEIVWIAGKRLDDRFKVKACTKTVLKITFAE